MIDKIKDFFGINKRKLYRVTEDGDWEMIDEEGREIDRDGFLKVEADQG